MVKMYTAKLGMVRNIRQPVQKKEHKKKAFTRRIIATFEKNGVFIARNIGQ